MNMPEASLGCGKCCWVIHERCTHPLFRNDLAFDFPVPQEEAFHACPCVRATTVHVRPATALVLEMPKLGGPYRHQ